MSDADSDTDDACQINKDEETDLPEEIVLSPTLKRVLSHDIATMHKKVNNMDLKKIKRRYRWYEYDAESDIETIRKNLKQSLAAIMTKNVNSIYRNENTLPYYVVMDFEATCEALNPTNYHHEIIEFPAVLVNSSTLEIEDTFRHICRPTVKPKLSRFCMDLTGITQKEVDAAEPFPKVLELFEKWLEKHKLGSERKFAIVTDGPWDMCRFLFVQCILSNIDYPAWAEQWVDLRKVFKRFYGVEKSFLRHMLEYFRMSFQGRQHCGIDDATNIALVLVRVICDGAVLLPNGKILAESMRKRIVNSVDSSKDLVPQLSGFAIEAEHVFVPWKEKLPTYRDVKTVRSMRIHALTKILNRESNFEAVLADTQLGIKELAVFDFDNYVHKKKKPKKKKRNF